MYVLVGYVLEGEWHDAGPLAIKKYLDPIRAGDTERSIETERYISVTLAFAEKADS
jgi:hypothetical protein